MYTKDKSFRITLRLNEEQFSFVKEQADTLGVSPSEFLRMVVNASLATSKKVTESVEVRVKKARQAKTKAPLSVRMKTFGEKMKAKWYVFRAGSDSLSDAIATTSGLLELESQ